MATVLANDKYRATTRTTWIASPADTAITVTAIPSNLPTIVTVGWETQYETVFEVTSTSGTDSSNYTLTGVTKLRGYSGNLPEGLAVNCLNNEEYINQWSTTIAAMQVDVDDAVDTVDALLQTSTVASSATPTPIGSATFNRFYITALAAAAEFAAPSGTPVNGNGLIIRIKDNGTARALTYNAIYRAIGVDLPTTTVLSKTHYLGFIYNSADSKWDCIAVVEEA